MGIVLGRITVETPKYDVVAQGEGFEVRQYAPQLAADVTYDGGPFKSGGDAGFSPLAQYMGALGRPHNRAPGGDKGEKIAMTAPVITEDTDKGEKIAMTAPVITEDRSDSGSSATAGHQRTTMTFLLPIKYTMDTIPKPTDPRVSLREVPSRKLAVIKFSGNATDAVVAEKEAQLAELVTRAGHKVAGKLLLARYNPPFTPWFLKTNEVMLPVE
eukprot:SM000004S14948  [mRNA]  locus=s4:424515:425772:+ [translate_table: standard]